MNKFFYKGKACIERINARKETDEEGGDRELTVDLKLIIMTGANIVKCFEPALKDFLFVGGGIVRNHNLKPIAFSHKLKDYYLSILGSTHFGATVSKISIEPHDVHMVFLSINVNFNPSGDEIARIAEYLNEDVDIMLQPSNEQIDFDEAQKIQEQAEEFVEESMMVFPNGK